MKILALEKETKQTQQNKFDPYLQDEAAKVYELYLSGIIRELYFHEMEHTAILILECSDANEAQKVLSELPLVKAGLITFDLIPLVPYSGFSRLFDA
jgi:muconolactone delta-isomerase